MKKAVVALTSIVGLFVPESARSLLDGDGRLWSVIGDCSYHGYVLRLNCSQNNNCTILAVTQNNRTVSLPERLCLPYVGVDYGAGKIMYCIDPPDCSKEDKEFLCC